MIEIIEKEPYFDDSPFIGQCYMYPTYMVKDGKEFWSVKEYDDGTAEFTQYSPAGEDFGFTVNAENAAREIYEYYDNFDVDDHIEMWIEAKRNGKEGIPSTRRLVDDAEAISEMLKILAGAVMSETEI